MGFNYVNPRDLKRKVTHYSNEETIPKADIRLERERREAKKSLNYLKKEWIGRYFKKANWKSYWEEGEPTYSYYKITHVQIMYGTCLLTGISSKHGTTDIVLADIKEYFTEEQMVQIRRESLKTILITI